MPASMTNSAKKLNSATIPASAAATALPMLNAQNCRLKARGRSASAVTSTIAATIAGLGSMCISPSRTASTAMSHSGSAKASTSMSPAAAVVPSR